MGSENMHFGGYLAVVMNKIGNEDRAVLGDRDEDRAVLEGQDEDRAVLRGRDKKA